MRGYVTKEQIERAKQMDLLSYLQRHEPENLKRVSGNTYCTVEHDSLRISNGKWHWWSRGIGGADALSYLTQVRRMKLPEAVQTILQSGSWTPPVSVQRTAPKQPAEKNLILPPPNSSNDKAIAYLQSRGIDRDVIVYCVRRKLLYESQKYHSVVFVGYDSNGTPRYGNQRGTVGDFKGECKGSDKRYAFHILSNAESAHLHVFEAAIDALSYATLVKMNGLPWQAGNYLSLGGVFSTQHKDVIPDALRQFLHDHPQISTLRLHLDQDKIGRDAAQCIRRNLQDKLEVRNEPPKIGKDVNEYLIQIRTAAAHRRRSRDLG